MVAKSCLKGMKTPPPLPWPPTLSFLITVDPVGNTSENYINLGEIHIPR